MAVPGVQRCCGVAASSTPESRHNPSVVLLLQVSQGVPMVGFLPPPGGWGRQRSQVMIPGIGRGNVIFSPWMAPRSLSSSCPAPVPSSGWPASNDEVGVGRLSMVWFGGDLRDVDVTGVGTLGSGCPAPAPSGIWPLNDTLIIH